MMNKRSYYSAPAIDALFELSREGRIKWRAFGLGVALASFMNGTTGKAWPTRGTLSEITGIEKSDISRVARELEQAGFMAAERRGGHSTLYCLATRVDSATPTSVDLATPVVCVQPPGRVDSATPVVCVQPPTRVCLATHNYNEQQLNRENNYNAELVGGTAKATGCTKANDTFKTASKAASNKINLSQDAPKARGCDKSKDTFNQTASTAATNKIDLLDTQEENPSGALSLLGPALSPTPSPSPFPDDVVLGWVDRFPHVDVPMAIERALSWHSEKGRHLSEVGMSNWLHRVRPGAPEYIDLEAQEREDAKWIQEVERAYPNDPAMQAHYWWRYKNERDGRIPDGVECREMSKEEKEERENKLDEKERK
jgi:hypothetical protein